MERFYIKMLQLMKLIDIVDKTPIRFAYRISFLTNFYRAPVLRRIEQQYGLIRPEWTVLICLAFHDGLNPRDICEITEQPSNTVSRGAASLVTKGLIINEPDPSDARKRCLFITEQGRVTYDGAMAICVEAEKAMIACLDDSELQTLDHLLTKMARAVPDWVRES